MKLGRERAQFAQRHVFATKAKVTIAEIPEADALYKHLNLMVRFGESVRRDEIE